jgi:phosphoesterase RecJ-like protein
MSAKKSQSVISNTHEAATAAGAVDEIGSLLAEFRAGGRYLVTSHARPDGDAVGSALALAGMLEQIGCETEIVLADPVPCVYGTLPGVTRIRHAAHAGSGRETAILLECDGIERTGLKGLEGRRLINIDHHASGRRFADVNWIDEQACAVAAMVYRLAVVAAVKITPAMATCLYTAVLTDTGLFTYPGTGPEAFALARDLVVHGADASQVARDVYFSNRAAKIRLLGAALNHMRCEGSLAWSWVTVEDFADTEAEGEDCEGVVNYLIGIDGVEAAVFLREIPGNQFRLSIRSKGRLDVAQVAGGFGGGGHRSASGCTLDGPLATAMARILKQLRIELGTA